MSHKRETKPHTSSALVTSEVGCDKPDPETELLHRLKEDTFQASPEDSMVHNNKSVMGKTSI